MALNVAIDGFAFKGDGSLGVSNIAYQAYFYHANSGSSPSKWNDTRIIEASGYYNINIGDADWLTQDGSASSGDVVIVVFWSPTTSDRTDVCSLLDEWSCFRIVLDGSSTYTTQVQIKPNICPNLSWSLASSGLVNVSVAATNSSNDQHQWDFMGTTFYHRNTWYTSLMTVNTVDNTDYYWGDTTSTLDLSGAAGSSHVWSASGDYGVEIVIEDACGCTVTGTDSIRIYNRTPVPDITMTPAVPEPNEAVTFQYTGTDVDDTITNVAWTIDDTGSYGNTDTLSSINGRDDVISHSNGLGTDWYGQSGNVGAFTNPGDHLVSIIVTWWDGFDYQVINYSETYTQDKFSGPSVNFSQDPSQAVVGVSVKFTNTSTNTSRVGTADGTEYNWTWTDNGVSISESNKPFSFELNKVPASTDCQAQLCASWNDGWDNKNSCIEKDVVFSTMVTISEVECYYNLNIVGTSSDGSVTSYGWTVSSGISSSGPWAEVWNSPIGIWQNDKKICFAYLGFFKIEGTVYGLGSPTSDYEILEVVEVCPESLPAEVISVCPPSLSSDFIAGKSIKTKEIKPSLRATMDLQPSTRLVHNNTNRPFPGPINI